MDCRSNCVNKCSKCTKFYFKTPFPFLRKKLYTLVWIPPETGHTSTKPRTLTSILHSPHGELLMVQDLSLALKADNIQACFISSDLSFHMLGPELDIVAVRKCAVACFY